MVQCTEIVLDNMKQVLLHARLILRGTTAEAQEQYKKVEEEITTAVASLRTVEECTGHMRRIIGEDSLCRDRFLALMTFVQTMSSACLSSMPSS